VRASQPIHFAGPAGSMEGIVGWPEAEPVAAGVLCHAHPQRGGTMHFKVVYRAAGALRRAGLVALRFNFRGVGASRGTFDDGRGEQDDALAALEEMARRLPQRPLVLGGFSFGAVVALRVASRDARVAAVFALGLPFHLVPELSFLNSLRAPCLVVQGEADEYGSAIEAERRLAEAPRPVSLATIAGADHFFTGRLGPLEDALAGWLAGRPWEGP
jgi:alpha/beta superfamily hydrolase